MHPLLIGQVADVLLGLQRNGVQVVMATNSYLMLEEFRLRVTAADQVRFHLLYRDPSGDVLSETSADCPRLRHNAIFKAYDWLYDNEPFAKTPREGGSERLRGWGQLEEPRYFEVS